MSEQAGEPPVVQMPSLELTSIVGASETPHCLRRRLENPNAFAVDSPFFDASRRPVDEPTELLGEPCRRHSQNLAPGLQSRP
jgi:hypothetical protein